MELKLAAIEQINLLTLDPWWISWANSINIFLCFFTLSSSWEGLDTFPSSSRVGKTDVASCGLTQPLYTFASGAVVLVSWVRPVPTTVICVKLGVLLAAVFKVLEALPPAISLAKVVLTTVSAKDIHSWPHGHWRQLLMVSPLSLLPAITVKIYASAEIKLLEFLSK